MLSFNLAEKVAIVTGGNGGIGLGIAHGLAAGGATIVIAARDEEKSALAAQQLAPHNVGIMTIATDVTDRSSVDAMVEVVLDAFGRIDILVNNAGTNAGGSADVITDDEWDLVMNVNMTGAHYCSQAVYPAMKAKGGGKIINIGSMMSIFGRRSTPAYAASKGAIVQYTKALACGWADDNIQANAILPGWIDTNLTRELRDAVPSLEEAVTRRTPAAKWGTPDDLAGLGLFLASPASDFITGAAIPADGGYSVQG